MSEPRKIKLGEVFLLFVVIWAFLAGLRACSDGFHTNPDIDTSIPAY